MSKQLHATVQYDYSNGCVYRMTPLGNLIGWTVEFDKLPKVTCPHGIENDTVHEMTVKDEHVLLPEAEGGSDRIHIGDGC